MKNRELIKKYRENFEEEYINELVENNRGLVTDFLKKNFPSKCYDEDYIQEGIFGVVMAIMKFDLNKNFKFSTYAVFWIRQRVFRHYLRDKLIRIPEWLYYKGERGTIEVNGEEHYINHLVSEDEEDRIYSREALDMVYKELKKMNPTAIMVFENINIQGHTLDETSKKLKMKKETVRQINEKAIHHMKKKLKELDYEF